MRIAAQAFKARVSLVATVLIAAATLGSAIAQSHPPKPPITVRLYVFDCGVIKAMDPKLFNFKPGELAETEMSVPAFLIVDPKGTLIWDTGSIPDVDFKGDTTPITEGYFYSDSHAAIAAHRNRLHPGGYHLSRALALSRRSRGQRQRIRRLDVAGAAGRA